MKRRDFLSRLGIGVATVAVMPKILVEIQNHYGTTKVAPTYEIFLMGENVYAGDVMSMGNSRMGVALYDTPKGQNGLVRTSRPMRLTEEELNRAIAARGDRYNVSPYGGNLTT